MCGSVKHRSMVSNRFDDDDSSSVRGGGSDDDFSDNDIDDTADEETYQSPNC
jgi:hypothetical protein